MTEWLDAASSDPATLQWMVGSPPPPDKLIQFADAAPSRFPARGVRLDTRGWSRPASSPAPRGVKLPKPSGRLDGHFTRQAGRFDDSSIPSPPLTDGISVCIVAASRSSATSACSSRHAHRLLVDQVVCSNLAASWRRGPSTRRDRRTYLPELNIALRRCNVEAARHDTVEVHERLVDDRRLWASLAPAISGRDPRTTRVPDRLLIHADTRKRLRARRAVRYKTANTTCLVGCCGSSPARRRAR